MFDFRYHALSLVAVFLALGIGILLGVTIGDSLVSEAEKGVRSSLRGDVLEARDEIDGLRAERNRKSAVVERAFPILVEDRLEGDRVAIVGLGGLPGDVEEPVTKAVEAAGAEIDSATALEPTDDLEVLREELGGVFERLGADDELLRRLGVRIGRSIVDGGTTVRRLSRALDDEFEGDYEGASAVVLFREPPEEDRGEGAEAFEEGLVDGLRRSGASVVGVERSETEPSQIGFFRDGRLSSVDNVEDPGGQAALVLALDGAAGTFGFKEMAEGPLPDVAAEP